MAGAKDPRCGGECVQRGAAAHESLHPKGRRHHPPVRRIAQTAYPPELTIGCPSLSQAFRHPSGQSWGARFHLRKVPVDMALTSVGSQAGHSEAALECELETRGKRLCHRQCANPQQPSLATRSDCLFSAAISDCSAAQDEQILR